MPPNSSLKSASTSTATTSPRSVRQGRPEQPQNAFILRLPSEILLDIFTIFRALFSQHVPWCPDTMDEDVEEQLCIQGALPYNHRRWIPSTTHVCSEWRNIAINAPQLWTTISITPNNYKWAAAMLRRSQNCTLTVVVDLQLEGKNGASKKVILSATKHLKRAKELVLNWCTPATLTKIFADAGALERLEYLRLDTGPGFNGQDEEDLFQLNDKTLQAPLLRTLTCVQSQPNYSAQFMKNLRHLSLRNPLYQSLHWLELLEHLRNMPQLESLDVKDDDTIEEDFLRPGERRLQMKVRMPSLKILRYVGLRSYTENFLSNIEAPHLEHLKMPSFKDDVIFKSSRLQASIAAFSEVTGRSLKGAVKACRLFRKDMLDEFNLHEFTVHMFHGPRAIPTHWQLLRPGLLPTIDTSFDVEDSDDTDDSDDYARDDDPVKLFFQRVRGSVETPAVFNNLVLLHVIDYRIECSDWRTGLGTLPKLKSIFLSKYIVGLFEALAWGQGRVSEDNPLAFPALSLIHVHDVAKRPHDLPDHGRVGIGKIVGNALSLRKSSGHPISDMVFSHCQGSPMLVGEPRKMILASVDRVLICHAFDADWTEVLRYEVGNQYLDDSCADITGRCNPV